MFGLRRRLGPAVCAALLALLLVLPAAAHAEDPSFTSDPVIQGDPVVGSTLTVAATWADTTPPTTATYSWLRCLPSTSVCTIIPMATDVTYVVTTDDVGNQLVAQVTLTNAPPPAVPVPKSSPPTAVVTAPPPPPPTPTPAPAPTTMGAASSAVAPKAPAFLRPFPVIRIRGFFASRGARITLLSVRGPRLAKVDVRCRGRGCPVGKVVLPTADTRVHRFERFLRAGILLQIRVTRPGRIGSYTSFLIRAHKAPKRTDRCLSVKGAKPIRCSAP